MGSKNNKNYKQQIFLQTLWTIQKLCNKRSWLVMRRYTGQGGGGGRTEEGRTDGKERTEEWQLINRVQTPRGLDVKGVLCGTLSEELSSAVKSSEGALEGARQSSEASC
jgi:hypothetical protein